MIPLRSRVLRLAAGALLLACRPAAESKPAAAFSGGELHVEVSLPGGAARTGPNELRVLVRDAAGAPVDDARVDVGYQMEMAGMAPMGGRVAAEPSGHGAYRAVLDLGMNGTWQLELSATRPSGAQARAAGSLRTGGERVELEGEARPVAETASGTVQIDPARLQKIGVRFATAERAPLERVIRATGSVGWDESRLVDVTPRVRGTIVDLAANTLGARVEKGEVLARLYSPELWAAQRDLRSALAAQTSARSSGAPDRADSLARAARARLRLFGLSEGDVDALAASAEPVESVPLRAPASGFLIEKRAVAGGPVEAGVTLFRIAPLGRVWIEARLPESDAGLVSVGQVARLRTPALPGRELEARIAYLYPSLDEATRTLRARLELDDAEGLLRPGNWVELELVTPLGERLQVPATAVIYAGPRRVVFVERDEGRLEPRTVELGVTGRDAVEIVSGLEPGERVVVSGNFLIAAESRLRSASEAW